MSAAPWWVLAALVLIGLGCLAWSASRSPVAPRAGVSRLDQWDGVRTDTQRIPVWQPIPQASATATEADEPEMSGSRFWLLVFVVALTVGILVGLLTRGVVLVPA